jgi:serine protease Do
MAMRRFVTVGPALVVLGTGALLLVAGPGVVRRLSAAKTAGMIEESRRALLDDDILARLDHATRLVAQAVTPSVVHVEISLAGLGGVSSGAGWVYDDLGHIVTNAHVVANSRRLLVQHEDGYSQEAEIVGMDVFTDVAVLKVQPGPSLFPMKRAKERRVQIGDRVFAFGSPFGQKFSMTEGVVSGLGRSARAAFGFVGISNFIQTDAAVNPGNSGGPLVNRAGELIGMNVAIANATSANGGPDQGQSAGISFAIPLATIEARVGQIIEKGESTPAILGIQYNDRTPAFLDQGGFRGTGILVNGVAPGGPANAAGIKAGDRLVLLDGEPVSSVDVMRALISTGVAGQEVRVKVLRDGATLDLTARLQAAPEEFLQQQHVRLLEERVGLFVRQFNGGVMVVGVESSTPAADEGFGPGMMIVKVADVAVASVSEMIQGISKAGLSRGKAVSVTVRLEDGSERDFVLRVFRLPVAPTPPAPRP